MYTVINHGNVPFCIPEWDKMINKHLAFVVNAHVSQTICLNDEVSWQQHAQQATSRGRLMAPQSPLANHLIGVHLEA